jgi:hypothetical protein
MNPQRRQIQQCCGCHRLLLDGQWMPASGLIKSKIALYTLCSECLVETEEMRRHWFQDMVSMMASTSSRPAA